MRPVIIQGLASYPDAVEYISLAQSCAPDRFEKEFGDFETATDELLMHLLQGDDDGFCADFDDTNPGPAGVWSSFCLFRSLSAENRRMFWTAGVEDSPLRGYERQPLGLTA